MDALGAALGVYRKFPQYSRHSRTRVRSGYTKLKIHAWNVFRLASRELATKVYARDES